VLALAVLASLLFASAAAAQVTTCLVISAPAGEREGFEKLVRSEIARHKTHSIVDGSGCRAHLRVELFQTAGSRYLTAQMDSEVPARFAVRDAAELTAHLEEAIRLVLKNDPIYLAEDITRLNALQRFGQAVLLRGRSSFRFELFDAVSRDERGPTTLPGIGFHLARGSGNWQIALRLYGAYSFDRGEHGDAALEVLAGADGCLVYELYDKEFWTPYGGACAGVQYFQFVGREHAGAPTAARAHDVGIAPALRLGARFFRWHSFDLDLFAEGYLPLSPAQDIDGVLLSSKGLYAPSVQVGLGIGF
jgi:hypothetical protein